MHEKNQIIIYFNAMQVCSFIDSECYCACDLVLAPLALPHCTLVCRGTTVLGLFLQVRSQFQSIPAVGVATGVAVGVVPSGVNFTNII